MISLKFLQCCRILFHTWKRPEFYIPGTCSQFIKIFSFFGGHPLEKQNTVVSWQAVLTVIELKLRKAEVLRGKPKAITTC